MERAHIGQSRFWLYGLIALAFAVVLGIPFALHREEQAFVWDESDIDAMDLPQKDLIIITPHSETIRTEFEHGFRRWAAETHGYDVQIEWLDVGGTLDAMKWVADRFKQLPDGINVDLFFGGGVDPFFEFRDRGLLQPCSLPEDVLSPIPQTYAGMELYDAKQRWFGACLAGFGIMYNKPVLEALHLPEPRTWADLGKPEYFTWVASADPRKSGSMHMVYEIILQAYGWEKGWEVVASIGANCRGFTGKASDVPKDVSTGEAACGMAIDLYALRAIAEAGSDRLAFRLPDGLTVVNPDGIAMLKGAAHPEIAQLFIEFVLSEPGQKLWVLRAGAPGGPKVHQLYRLPLIPGFAQRFGNDAVVEFDPFEFEGGADFDPEKKNKRWRILNDLLGACIIDAKDELAAAWEHIRALPEDDARRRELLAPPLSEDALMRLAADKWDDASFRAETMADWSRTARAKYRRLMEAD